ncbi:MAG TPA: hypothetical protein VFK14_06580 [Solirubrobacterales bacterium]|nr:hypothetical protein [Solirubrobacterales bacterium]
MKHLKMLGLLAVAAAAFMAFAGNAYAAPVLTHPAGTAYTGSLEASLTGSAKLEAGIEDTCSSGSVGGTVETNTETSASGKISSLAFGNCSTTTTVIEPVVGTLSINDSGEVTAKGANVTVSQFGISCVYGAGEGTLLGTLTPGEPAVLNVLTTELPKQSGGLFCASEGTWEAQYTVTNPSSLFLN